MSNNPHENPDEKTRQQKEFKLQCHIVNKHEIYFPHVVMTAFPGRPGDAQDGFFKKMMGVRAGVPDILLWWKSEGTIRFGGGDGREWDTFHAGVVEVKVDARVSSSQNKFMSAIRHIGGHDGVVHSWEEYYRLLCFWGIKPTSECKVFDKPNYQTEQQKFHASHEFFAP